MEFREFLRRPISSIIDWFKDHTDFIASKVTIMLAIGFIIIAIIYLMQSLDML